MDAAHTRLLKNKPCVIFDIDNTIADTTHRAHHVNSPIPKERKWKEFFSEMDKDKVMLPTVFMLLRYYRSGLNIILVTGRPDNSEEATVKWLADNSIPYHKLIMKNKHEYRLQGPLFKAKIAGQLQDEGYNIKLAVDDEENVRQMYTLIGIKNSAPALT